MSRSPQIGRRAVALVGMLLAFVLFSGRPAQAAAPLELEFVTHASFFSQETKQPAPLDPQVFVRDAAAPAGKGPQGIAHAAGYRPLLLADPPDSALFSATGKPLGFTAGKWLGATGRVTINPDARGGAEVVAVFRHLRPKGFYSLFENHFETTPISFTPLDGDGTRNSFKAARDGSARVTLHGPQMLTSTNAVLLVYHSDGNAHGQSRGDIGITAHHQLIAKVP